MPPWSWFVVALAIGGALLTVALLADRRARRRATGADEPAPKRRHADVDRHVPAYITQDEIDALPAPGDGESGSLAQRGEGFAFGHAHPDFATFPDGATWADADVLIVDGMVRSMRELLAPLSQATDEHPLVVVAADIAPEVLTTLAANRRALQSPVLAAIAERRDRTRLAELTGGEPLSEADLQAGYLPDHALGRAARWSSTPRRTWVQPPSTSG